MSCIDMIDKQMCPIGRTWQTCSLNILQKIHKYSWNMLEYARISP